jgi:hypothetical protein
MIFLNAKMLVFQTSIYTIQEKYVLHKTPKGSEYNSQGWSPWKGGHSFPVLKGRNKICVYYALSGLVHLVDEVPGIPLRSIPGCYIPTPSGFYAERIFLEWYSI